MPKIYIVPTEHLTIDFKETVPDRVEEQEKNEQSAGPPSTVPIRGNPNPPTNISPSNAPPGQSIAISVKNHLIGDRLHTAQKEQSQTHTEELSDSFPVEGHSVAAPDQHEGTLSNPSMPTSNHKHPRFTRALDSACGLILQRPSTVGKPLTFHSLVCNSTYPFGWMTSASSVKRSACMVNCEDWCFGCMTTVNHPLSTSLKANNLRWLNFGGTLRIWPFCLSKEQGFRSSPRPDDR